MTIGALTFAFGSDYQKMAAAQAWSFDRHEIQMAVVVEGNATIEPELARCPAQVLRLRSRVNLPFEFEKYAYDLSPFDLTIKTDADLLVPPGWSGLPSWVSQLDYVTGIPYTIQSTPVLSSPYRQAWTQQGLPEVYSAFFAFNRGPGAQEFFRLVRLLFDEYYVRQVSKIEPRPSTDLIYSIAWAALKSSLGPTLRFVHMKPHTSGFKVWRHGWANVLNVSTMDTALYLNGIQIVDPIHYHDKVPDRNQRSAFTELTHHVPLV